MKAEMKQTVQSKPVSKSSAAMTVALWYIGVLAICYFIFLMAQYFLPISIDTIGADLVPPQSSATGTSSIGIPKELSIPSLHIDTAIESVGVNKNGNMKVPSTNHTVAWYNKGAVPGQVGAAVIVGHLDNGLGLNAVFANLKNLTPGAIITITDENHVAHDFEVTHMETYPYDQAPLKKIFLGDAGKKELNLITCSGTWIGDAHNYTDRLVVYAVETNVQLVK
jgi:sortase (surface protein transpeptidase)